MDTKELISLIIVIITGGGAGYLFYLYHEKKKKKNLDKEETMLTSILTFISVALIGFFISFTKNYFYMFLIVIGVTIGTSIILGLLLRWKKLKKEKNKKDPV